MQKACKGNCHLSMESTLISNNPIFFLGIFEMLTSPQTIIDVILCLELTVRKLVFTTICQNRCNAFVIDMYSGM